MEFFSRRLESKNEPFGGCGAAEQDSRPLRPRHKFTTGTVAHHGTRKLFDLVPIFQIYHAFQTGEALRAKYPDLEWLPLVGFIHDFGKVMVEPQFGGLPQWAVVGDTFPVGCAHSTSIVMHEYFKENPDTKHPLYE